MVQPVRIAILTLLLLSFALLAYAQKWEWARSAGSSGFEKGVSVAVDAAGNNYITGGFEGTIAFGGFTLRSAGGTDIFLVKHDAHGKVLWAKQAGGAGGETVRGIAVDTAGNVYITGSFLQPIRFGSITLVSGVNYQDGYGSRYNIFVAKFNASGGTVWAVNPVGNRNSGRSIGVDAAGNVYVTGGYDAKAVFGNTTLEPSPWASENSFIVKYDSSGRQVWAKRIGGDCYSAAIRVDAAGNFFLTGNFNSRVEFGTVRLESVYGNAVFVAKYDRDGQGLWASQGDGTGISLGNSIAFDAAGNSYVTGYFTYDIAFGAIMLSRKNGKYETNPTEVFIAKFDAGGKVAWARKAGGAGSNQGYGIAVDAAGNSVVAGVFQQEGTFGPYSLSSGSKGYYSGSNGDMFVAAYDAEGQVGWARQAYGNAAPAGIGMDAAGNSYVVGTFRERVVLGADSLASAGSIDAFVAKHSPRAPTVALGVLPFSALCAGSPAEVPFAYTGSFAAGNTFTIQLSDAAGSFASPLAIGSGTISPIAASIPAGVPPGSRYRVRVMADAPAMVSGDNGADLTIAALPEVAAGADETVCVGAGAFAMSGFSPAGGAWSGEGVSADGVFDPSQVAAGPHALTYTVRSGGCSSSASKTVTVGALPTLVAALVPAGCSGRPGVAPLTVSFTNGTSGAARYLWDFGDGDTSTEQAPSHLYSEGGTYRVALTAYTGDGCAQAAQVAEVTVESRRQIPNIITPNGDGMNEVFVAEVSCLPLDLQVYSRSGRLVLQKHGYQNDWSGEGLANGTYYYLLRDAGGATWKGWVEVLK